MANENNKKDKENDISLRIRESTNFQSLKLKQVNLRFEIFSLDSIVAFIYKESVLRTPKALKNIYKLFLNINPEPYSKNPDLNTRFWVILKSLALMVDSRLESMNAIKAELTEDKEANDEIRKYVNTIENLKIGYEDSKKLLKRIDDRLRFGYVITVKEILRDFLDAIDDEEYSSFQEISNDLEQLCISIVNIRRNVNSMDSEEMFTLDPDKMDDLITSAVTKLQDRMKMLKTGIYGLNVFLAPAYLSKRLYMYLAFPGGGKSQILLKSALDIKKYNEHVKAKDPNKRPCVTFITMENSIEETIERIFNMVASQDDIRNFTPDQVIKKLRNNGKLTLTDKNNINIIIKYYPNRSISTNDLYGIIQELDDGGDETIALILDYVKRIAPAESAPSEKEELKNITNELKNLATYYDIPVITAQQLNRVASSVVDTALQAKKEDVTKLIGRDGVAGAWEIIENSDWVCVLNQEVKQDTLELFMTFKLLKRRYRSSDEDENMRKLQYFNQPYEPGNEIKLMDDVGLTKPLMTLSMSNQMMALEDVKRGKKNAVEREEKVKTANQMYQMMDFDPFDVDKSIQFDE
jgi:replicative DNA helicase